MELIRRLGGLTAVGCRNDRRIMLWDDYDSHEEPSPAASPKVRHPPAFVLSNSPPERKSVGASVEWAVEPLVHRLREQGTPAAQTVQVVGCVKGEIPDRAMHRTRRPQANGKLTRFVEREFNNAPVAVGVTAGLVRSRCLRGIAEAQTLHSQRPC